MFALSDDILKKIERQYQYELVHNEDIAEDEKKKFLAVAALPDYRFTYRHRNVPVDITLRWIVRNSGYKEHPCELALEYDFDYCELHFHSGLGDDAFDDMASVDIDEKLARSYAKQIMELAELEVFESDMTERTGDMW